MRYTSWVILFLVRHALTPVTGSVLIGRLPGYPLSEKGREQAAATGQRLAGAPLKAVYSSPMERCVETATAVAATTSSKSRRSTTWPRSTTAPGRAGP